MRSYTAPVDVNPSPAALRDRIIDALPPAARDALTRLLAVAPDAHAAGGAVRDAIMPRPTVDLDIVTEQDAIEIARAAWPEAHLTAHERFRTASAPFDGFWIDLATARTETYTHPGALPDVTPADIEADLARRDFSVNAMALSLAGDARLGDPHSGAADIDAKLIRVLHDRSFEDDATRIFRAHRYASRLGFSVEAHTRSLLRDGVRHIATIGGERLRREIELILSEAQSGAILAALAADGALAAIHAALRWDASASDASTPSDIDRYAAGFALLAANATAPDADAIVARLRLTREQAAAVRGIVALRGIEAMLARAEAKPSGVVVLLDRYPATAVAALSAGAASPVARALAARYLAEWRHERPILRGDELQAMGVPAGPQVARGLALIRAARLDGWAQDRGDEQALVLRFAKSIRDSSAMLGHIDLDLDGFSRN